MPLRVGKFALRRRLEKAEKAKTQLSSVASLLVCLSFFAFNSRLTQNRTRQLGGLDQLLLPL